MNYESKLAALYVEELLSRPDQYLHAHSRNRAVVQRQVSIFKRYSKYIPESGAILDWGCRQAPDACLVRMLRGDGPELFGCDVDAASYNVFFQYSNLAYKTLTHAWQLPYEDNQFDVVIGSGVLEHVPNDSATLSELYRVIKPGGYFIMTMLPNVLSYTEFLNRRLGNPHHLRIYGLSEAKHMFMHHGFLPVESGYHQVFPSLSSPSSGVFDSTAANKLVEALASCNEVGEKIWPFRCFATNIFIFGQKVVAFHG